MGGGWPPGWPPGPYPNGVIGAAWDGRPVASIADHASKQPGPGSQIAEELVEHRVEGVRLGNPSVGLLHVQNRVDDLAEHLVEGGSRIIAPGRAHAGTDAGRRPPLAQG